MNEDFKSFPDTNFELFKKPKTKINKKEALALQHVRYLFCGDS
jgi:hypothetical protein